MGQVAARPRGVPGSSLASDAVTVHEEAGPTLLYTVPIVIVYGLLLCCFASQINSLLMLINWGKKKKLVLAVSPAESSAQDGVLVTPPSWHR